MTKKLPNKEKSKVKPTLTKNDLKEMIIDSIKEIIIKSQTEK